MRTKTLVGKLKVPFVESFGDYHDIEYKKDALSEFFPSIRAVEINDDNIPHGYWGLFYEYGNKPTKQEITAMLRSAGALDSVRHG
jgi:hypothetical protein